MPINMVGTSEDRLSRTSSSVISTPKACILSFPLPLRRLFRQLASKTTWLQVLRLLDCPTPSHSTRRCSSFITVRRAFPAHYPETIRATHLVVRVAPPIHSF